MNYIDNITPEYLLSKQYINDMLIGYSGNYNQFINSNQDIGFLFD